MLLMVEIRGEIRGGINGLKHFKDPKVFTKYSNNIHDIYQNIEKFNPNEECKILIVFNDMIADILSNKKPNPVVIKIFIRGTKLYISLAFITKSYFAVPKRYLTKFYTLFFYENSKQTRLTNYIKSFIR